MSAKAVGISRDLGSDVESIILPSFTAYAASKICISRRTVQESISIASKIAPEVKKFVHGTALADRKKATLIFIATSTGKTNGGGEDINRWTA